MKTNYRFVFSGLLALSLGLLFYTGLYCSDDTRYFIGAYKLAHGLPISVGNVAERRLIFLLPAALNYFLFESIFVLIFSFLAYYISLVFVTYASGFLLGGQRTAYVAALAVALHPLLYVYAGALLPDISSSLFTALSLLALLAWLDRLGSGHATLDWLLLPSAGFAIGLSAGIKESGLVFIVLPLGLFCLLFLQDWKFNSLLKRAGLFALGFATFLVLESILFYIFAKTFHSTLLSASEFKQYPNWQGLYPWDRFAFLFRNLLTFLPWTFVLPFLFGPLLIFWSDSTGKDREKLIITLGYFVWPFLYFTIGTLSFSEYIPTIIQARYYAPCVMPAMLLLGLFLTRLQERPSPQKWQELPAVRKTLRLLPYGVLGLMVLEGLAGNWEKRGTVYAASAKISLIAAVLDAHQRFPNIPIVDTPGSAHPDVMRCRKILLEYPRLSNALLKGQFVYDDVERLQPPFILIGHGDDFWNTPKSEYVKKIQEKIRRENWRVRLIGYKYLTKNDLFFADGDSCTGLQKRVWFDRLALDQVDSTKKSYLEQHFHMETYLVEKSTD